MTNIKKLLNFLFEDAQYSGYRIYLDMDGVLADFEKGIENDAELIRLNSDLNDLIKKIYDRPKSDVELKDELKGEQKDPQKRALKKIIGNIKSQEMRIAKQQGFFENLQLMPGAEELVAFAREAVGSNNVYILTAPIQGSEFCEPEKQKWVEQKFGIERSHFICDPEKATYAAPNHILIDDNEKYINPWKASGGIGILHTDAASSKNEFERLMNEKNSNLEK